MVLRQQATLEVIRGDHVTPHPVRVFVGGPRFERFTSNGFTDKYVRIAFVERGG